MSGIALIDVGMGNLRSVERALVAALGGRAEIHRTEDPGRVREADVVVFPGQGAFGDCSVALQRHGAALTRSIKDHIEADRPYLGICLGLQVLFEDSDEAPGRGGMGVFAGRVTRLQERVEPDGTRIKVPHMGWNTVQAENEGARWVPDDAWFYFVHSYAVRPGDPSVVAARSTHGAKFCCAVARGRLLGVQFHPEKSQRVGIELIQRWFHAMENGP